MIKSGGFLTLPGVGLFQYLKSLPTGPLSKPLLLAWSNLAMAVLALWSMVTGIIKAREKWTLEPLILALWGIMLLCARFNPLWVESITGLGRIAAPIFLILAEGNHPTIRSEGTYPSWSHSSGFYHPNHPLR